MRYVLFILFVGTSGAGATEQSGCYCEENNYWPEAIAEPMFAKDPAVEPGLGFTSGVSETDVGISPDGECLIHNSFPDAPLVETYIDKESGEELTKFRWENLAGDISFLTLDQAKEKARNICWPEYTGS